MEQSEKKYKLDIDARILELLGPSLYTNIYYVLAELIANAYDANAKNVYIIKNENDIRIEDDGHGMSYRDGDIENYLNVAKVSRDSESNAFTDESKKRRKMGRKGVGKLAALSVSENVDVLTVKDNEKSGFVLSRHPKDGKTLKPINDKDIVFSHITDSGTAIVMRDPQYQLHKNLKVVERNLLKIFPLTSDDFRIHITQGNETVVIKEYERNIAGQLVSLITLGSEFSYLHELVPVEYQKYHRELLTKRDATSFLLKMKDRDNEEKEYTLEIKGWIGTYKTTRGRKTQRMDFPDNFISLFANKKMGEFNILPIVGQNKLNEVYVVGQLHIDLFELSELPDMALSNRQGYKSDDPRYQKVLDFIRENLLPDILRKRDLYADLKKNKQKEDKLAKEKEKEAELKKQVDEFVDETSREAAKEVSNGSNLSEQDLRDIVSKAINDNMISLGLKSKVDSQKKKILISHTGKDKSIVDAVYAMLLHNNIPPEDILYTNCDDEKSRLPVDAKLYDYLRDFFVDSYSNQKIFTLFISSDNMATSWGAVIEVGAAWITKMDHIIVNIASHKPSPPLDTETVWATIRQDEEGKEFFLYRQEADIFCQRIEYICDALKYKKKDREENIEYLRTLIIIK